MTAAPDWSIMSKYIILRSFVDIRHGRFSDGDEVELTAQQAKDLAPFIRPAAGSKAPKVETAEAQHTKAETADMKPSRKSKK